MPATLRKQSDYSGTPLPRKLGIVSASVKAGTTPMVVTLLAAPQDFPQTLGALPNHVTLTTRLTPRTSLALCFVRSVADLNATVELLVLQLPKTASVWIIHPKAAHKPGFNQNDVRDAGLACNLVDYKVCSVTEDWSGLKFAHRRP